MAITLGVLLLPGGVVADTGPRDGGPSGDVADATSGLDSDGSGPADATRDVRTDDGGDVASDATPMDGGDGKEADAITDTADGGVNRDVTRDVTSDAGRETGIPDAFDGGRDAKSRDVESDTEMIDAGDMDAGDMDGRDMMTSDTADGGPSDAAMDGGRDGGKDAGRVDVDTFTGDTGPSDGGDIDAAPSARFSGRVFLQGTNNNGGVSIVLEAKEGDARFAQTTDTRGRFAFEAIPLGQYQVTLNKTGFAMRGETFQLDGDREQRYRLFRDQSVDFRVRAIFSDNASPPSTVDFELKGPRGTFEPDEPISVENGRAVWTREELGVGRWTVRASAPEFETISFSFEVRGEREERRQLSATLHMLSADRGSLPVETESGCSCDNEGGGGGGFRGAPGGGLTTVLFIAGLATIRRRY